MLSTPSLVLPLTLTRPMSTPSAAARSEAGAELLGLLLGLLLGRRAGGSMRLDIDSAAILQGVSFAGGASALGDLNHDGYDDFAVSGIGSAGIDEATPPFCVTRGIHRQQRLPAGVAPARSDGMNRHRPHLACAAQHHNFHLYLPKEAVIVQLLCKLRYSIAIL